MTYSQSIYSLGNLSSIIMWDCKSCFQTIYRLDLQDATLFFVSSTNTNLRWEKKQMKLNLEDFWSTYGQPKLYLIVRSNEFDSQFIMNWEAHPSILLRTSITFNYSIMQTTENLKWKTNCFFFFFKSRLHHKSSITLREVSKPCYHW